jgi:hypothetical protein
MMVRLGHGGIEDVENDPPACGSVQTIDPSPLLPDPLCQAEPRQNCHSGRLDHQTRPNRLRSVETLEQFDPLSRAGEQQRGGKAGDPASGNTDPSRRHQRQLPKIVHGGVGRGQAVIGKAGYQPCRAGDGLKNGAPPSRSRTGLRQLILEKLGFFAKKLVETGPQDSARQHSSSRLVKSRQNLTGQKRAPNWALESTVTSKNGEGS